MDERQVFAEEILRIAELVKELQQQVAELRRRLNAHDLWTETQTPAPRWWTGTGAPRYWVGTGSHDIRSGTDGGK